MVPRSADNDPGVRGPSPLTLSTLPGDGHVPLEVAARADRTANPPADRVSFRRRPTRCGDDPDTEAVKCLPSEASQDSL